MLICIPTRQMRLRVRFQGKAFTLNLEESATLKDLESSIKSLTQRDDLKVLYKFPLVELDLSDSSKDLKSAGLESSETLTLEPANAKELTRGIAPVQKPIMVLREISDDNSCLFNAIGYVLENKCLYKAQYLRDMVAEYILARPLEYTTAVLGKSPAEYGRWIRQSDKWGGAIELSIFSEIYGVEIGSFDVQTGRMDLFGEGRSYSNRVYLQYTGIHYEAFAQSPKASAPASQDRTIFPSADTEIYEQVRELVQTARAAHRYTDTSHFTLRCNDCQLGLRGQASAFAFKEMCRGWQVLNCAPPMTAATANKNAPSAVEIDGVSISGCPMLFPSIQIDSEAVVANENAAGTRTVRYTSTSSHVKRSADGTIRVTPSQKEYLLQVPTKRPNSVGLMLVGWGGNNGSTLTASLLAHQHNVTWKSRRGVEKPNFYGSLVMASTCALGFDQESGKEVTAPIYQLAPFVDPKNLVVGGWDISSMNLADACDRAQVLEPTLIERLAPQMSALKPLPSIYDPTFIASNQSDRADNVIAGSKQEQLEQVRKDIREFKEKNSLEELIILWTANTERYTKIQSGIHDTWANLEAAIAANHSEISPSTLFAVASILEAVPFINGSPQNTFVPAVIDLASLKGVSIGGDDFKSGQTKMKSVLTDFLVSSGIKPVSIVSYNHLGNNDGKNLVEEAQFKSKEISKSGVVDDIIQSNPVLYPIEKGQTAPKNPDHVIIIEYVPAVGDSKRAMDEYESEIFMGGRSTISIHNVCEDSLLAAPLMLDLVLLTQYLSKIRIARTTSAAEPTFEPFHPILSILSFLLKAPLVPGHAPIVNALMKQRKAIEGLLRACVGLPAVDDLVLEQRIKQ